MKLVMTIVCEEEAHDKTSNNNDPLVNESQDAIPSPCPKGKKKKKEEEEERVEQKEAIHYYRVTGLVIKIEKTNKKIKVLSLKRFAHVTFCGLFCNSIPYCM
ncbi:hypothetical protein F8M41_013477 [Gigaspora margarita]|uniref:Uncharacterized protein n=1 Tax=Gigaspora margarita TaxID=4874 RepID=A0A8H3ZYU8_GIGMA|nr:hypothetical protein F8M41_013477 [Gigaspora margarita]